MKFHLKNASFETRILYAASLIGFSITTISIIINQLNDYPVLFNLILAFASCLFATIFFLNRKYRKKGFLKVMFLAAMTLSNNSAWFYNEGLLGSTPFLFGFAVMGIPFIYDRHQKKVLGFVALNVLLLIIVQHFFPGSVIGYPDGFSRFVDLASVFMFYLAITGITIYVFNRMYRKEKRTIEKQNRMLEHQKIELAEKNIRLEELTRNKELITGMIIHDLKNPLTTILGLSDQYSSAESMKRVNHSGKQMLDLVMNILDVQKFESARMEINRMPTCFPRSCGNRFPDFLIPSMKKT